MKTSVAVGSVFTVGVFASVLFAAALATSPSLKLLGGSEFILVKQAQIRILQVSMTIVSSAYTVFAAVLLYLARREKNAPLFRFTLIALAMIIAALLYSMPTDIAYNQQILSWDTATPPADRATVCDS